MVQSTRKLVAEGHELVKKCLCVEAFCDIQGRDRELLSDAGAGPLSPRANGGICYCYPLGMEGAKLI